MGCRCLSSPYTIKMKTLEIAVPKSENSININRRNEIISLNSSSINNFSNNLRHNRINKGNIINNIENQNAQNQLNINSVKEIDNISGTRYRSSSINCPNNLNHNNISVNNSNSVNFSLNNNGINRNNEININNNNNENNENENKLINVLTFSDPNNNLKNDQNNNSENHENINNEMGGDNIVINNHPNLNNNQSSNQNHNSNNNIRNNELRNINIELEFEPFLQSNNLIDFNYKIIENEYVGEGIKRMNAYISPVTKEELEKIRENFWSSRTEGNKEIWEILHLICNDNTLNDDDINSFLLSAGLETLKGCINITFDDKGEIYEIPNYCINEPSRYEIKSKKDKPIKENIEIKINNFGEKIKIKTNNYTFIKDIKKYIIKHSKTNLKKGMNIDYIRLFFGGKELSNDKQLWYYNINNKYIIQMVIKNS